MNRGPVCLRPLRCRVFQCFLLNTTAQFTGVVEAGYGGATKIVGDATESGMLRFATPLLLNNERELDSYRHRHQKVIASSLLDVRTDWQAGGQVDRTWRICPRPPLWKEFFMGCRPGCCGRLRLVLVNFPCPRDSCYPGLQHSVRLEPQVGVVDPQAGARARFSDAVHEGCARKVR